MANVTDMQIDGATKIQRAHESRVLFEELITLDMTQQAKQTCAVALFEIQQGGGETHLSDFQRLYPNLESFELRMIAWFADTLSGFAAGVGETSNIVDAT